MWMDATNSTQLNACIECDELNLHTNKAPRSHKIVQHFELLRSPHWTKFCIHNRLFFSHFFRHFNLSTWTAKAHYVCLLDGCYFSFIECITVQSVWIFLLATISGTTNTNSIHYAIAHTPNQNKRMNYGIICIFLFSIRANWLLVSAHLFYSRGFQSAWFSCGKTPCFCRLKWKRTREKKVKKTKWVIHD